MDDANTMLNSLDKDGQDKELGESLHAEEGYGDGDGDHDAGASACTLNIISPVTLAEPLASQCADIESVEMCEHKSILCDDPQHRNAVRMKCAMSCGLCKELGKLCHDGCNYVRVVKVPVRSAVFRIV